MTESHASVVAATAEVRIQGRRSGSAVLVAPGCFLTAAHVVAEAVPDQAGSIQLSLPHSEPLTAELDPQGGEHSMDFAVLRALSGENHVRPIGIAPGRRLPPEVLVFGYPKREREGKGVWRRFSTAGPTSAGTVQLDWQHAGTLLGHSGGPVVDPRSGLLIGILIEGSDEGLFDRFLPLAQISRAWNGLPRPLLFAGSESRAYLSARAHGQLARMRDGDLFRGRHVALETVREWITRSAGAGSPLVITGRAGSGKSAVLGRAALAAEREPRTSLDIEGVVYYARGATARKFADVIGGALGLGTGLAVLDLLDTVDDLADHPRLLVIMVDALDEAATDVDRRHIAEGLRELARVDWIRVVVATRPLSADERLTSSTLLRQLGVNDPQDSNLVDLDADVFADEKAIADYAEALLGQLHTERPGPAGAAWSRYRTAPALRASLGQIIAKMASRNFLVAALAADGLSLRREVLDPDDLDSVRRLVPMGLGEALDKYFEVLEVRERARLRAVLTALAYVRGSGASDKVWLRIAHAIGYSLDRLDIETAKSSRAADYLLTTVVDGTYRSTRLFHQALADQLLKDRDGHEHRAVFRALLEAVQDAGGWRDVDRYIRVHAAEHAADSGQLVALISDPSFIVHTDLDRLASVLHSVPPSRRSMNVHVVRMVVDRSVGSSDRERRMLLLLAARHVGLDAIAAEIDGMSDSLPTIRWAHRTALGIRAIEGSAGSARSVTCGHDPEGAPLIATGGAEGVLQFWDLATRLPIGRPFIAHRKVISCAALASTSDGLVLLVTGGEDGTIRRWEVPAGTPIGDRVLDAPNSPGSDWGYPVFSVALWRQPDGRLSIASAGPTGLRLRDATSGELLTELSDGFGTAVAVKAATRWGTLLACALLPEQDPSPKKHTEIRLWRVETGECLGGWTETSLGTLDHLAFGDFGQGSVCLASGWSDGSVRIWSPVTGTRVNKWRAHRGPVVGLASVDTAPDTPRLVTAGSEGILKRWDSLDGSPAGVKLADIGARLSSLSVGHLTHRRTVIALGSDEGPAHLIDPDGVSGEVKSTDGRGERVEFVASTRTTSGKTRLVSLQANGSVADYDPSDGKTLAVAVPPQPGITSVDITDTGDHDVIAWAGFEGRLGFKAGDEPPVTCHGHSGWVQALCFAAGPRDETLLVSGGLDRTVRIWRIDEDSPFSSSLVGHEGGVAALAFGVAPSGEPVLASGGDDWSVHLWSLDPARGPIASLRCHCAVKAVALLTGTDGELLVAAAGSDGSLRIWLPRSASERSVAIRAHRGRIAGLASVRVAGRHVLASAGQDRTVKLWEPTGPPRLLDTIPLYDEPRSITASGASLYLAAGEGLVCIDITTGCGRG